VRGNQELVQLSGAYAEEASGTLQGLKSVRDMPEPLNGRKAKFVRAQYINIRIPRPSLSKLLYYM
jgi:hypothetical protein